MATKRTKDVPRKARKRAKATTGNKSGGRAPAASSSPASSGKKSGRKDGKTGTAYGRLPGDKTSLEVCLAETPPNPEPLANENHERWAELIALFGSVYAAARFAKNTGRPFSASALYNLIHGWVPRKSTDSSAFRARVHYLYREQKEQLRAAKLGLQVGALEIYHRIMNDYANDAELAFEAAKDTLHGTGFLTSGPMPIVPEATDPFDQIDDETFLETLERALIREKQDRAKDGA